MSNKGMIIPVLGTVLVVIAVVLASIIGLVVGPTFEGGNIQRGGLAISIHNNAEFWIKAIDESVQIISRRSAYELGKSGGIIGPEVFTWFTDYPTMETLQKNLEAKIKESLPEGEIKDGKIIQWGPGVINALYTDCGLIASSKCFFVKGNKTVFITDKAIEAKISLDPHKFYLKIDSNYFRLLNAGRTLLDSEPFKTIIFVEKNLGKLQREINNAKSAGDPRFKDLTIETPVSGNVVEFTIFDKTCLLNNDNYCIAPLKPEETGIINPMNGKQIPFDYLKLKFLVDVENPIAPPLCVRSNPTVSISPVTQQSSAGSALTYTVNVKNNDDSNCEESIFTLSNTICPSGFTCSLNKNSVTVFPGSTDTSTKITVTSQVGASPGIYTFKVKAVNFGENSYWMENSANYVIPVPIPCTGTVTPTISGTGTCTIGASMTADHCDGQSWQITDGSNGCSGTVFGSSYSSSCPTQWSVSAGASGTTYTYILRIGGIQKDSKSVTCSPPACIRSNPTVSISPLSNTGSAGTTLTYAVSVKNNDAFCSNSVFDLTYTCPSGWSCSLSKNSVTLSAGNTDSSIAITVTSPSSANSGTYSFSVTATNNGAATYKGTGTGSYVIPVVPVCSADFSATILNTGTCTVLAGFTSSNCDNKPWQIKDIDTNAIVCNKALPDNICQWQVLSGATGTTYNYALFIDGIQKGTQTVTCDPTPECTRDSDCTGGSRCTDKKCNLITQKCEYPVKPAGTIFATKTGTCPKKCVSGTKYTPITNSKSCNRVCDGTTANEPDCSFTPCTDADYIISSCGTGVPVTCPDKCESSKEYSSGKTKTCNIGCADAFDCASSCTAPGCTNDLSSYNQIKDCMFGCSGNSCLVGKWCPSYGGTPNGCGDTPDCLWVICDGCYGNECFTTAQCVEPTVSSPPSCAWTDLYWLCWCGWSPCCCSSTRTCTIPASNCYLDTVNCKYS